MSDYNPFSKWDELINLMKFVSPFETEKRAAIARQLEQERAVLLSCGFNPANRTHCTECY